jgi:hypothetical protein
MNTPCGEIANASPNRNRSRTGQPIEATGSIAAVYRRRRNPAGQRRPVGQIAAIERPSSRPPATSLG